ncbi:hypothetical protein D1641_09610 [Colidextribacter sp. OB.20]|uniref:hypothetical protein n=1 Tax=Colidextribacter sp. OB.20 TaxID=2304568 RepID=UPI00136ECE74|nr:hypothetical protein [Colidextribacter sp. OB.20]NBI10264.1 hypothetical protein [Colidextribacter sp. OB.20]
MAKIEIKTEGVKGKVLVDGKEMPGVRSYSVHHDAGSIPMVRLDLIGTDLFIDGNGFIPALPEVFKSFYRPIETTDEFPVEAPKK